MHTLLTKRPRSDSDADQNHPVPSSSPSSSSSLMLESLRGSTAALTSSFNTLSQSVSLLKSLTPNAQRLTAITTMTRKCEMVTDKEIMVAQHVVSRETIPEIESILKEAAIIIDRLATSHEETARKAAIQEEIVQSKRHKNEMDEPMQTMSVKDRLKMMDVRKKTMDCQLRQDALFREIQNYDEAISESQRELDKLNEKINRLQKLNQRQAHEEKEQEKDMTSVGGLSRQHIDEESMAADERRLLDELKQIERQLEDQQRRKQARPEKENTTDKTLETTAMDIDVEPSLKDHTEEQVAVLQAFMEYLRHTNLSRKSSSVQPGDLRRYMETLQKDQVKTLRPTALQFTIDNNLNLLKIYCKTLMTKDNMGFVAQRLVDILFRHTSSTVTREMILKEFDGSSRQKEMVEKILSTYALSFVVQFSPDELRGQNE